MRMSGEQEAYLRQIAEKHGQGDEETLIKENLSLTAEQRVLRGNYYASILFAMFPFERERLRCCTLTKGLAAVLDDYAAAKKEIRERWNYVGGLVIACCPSQRTGLGLIN